ncbi:MAG TPA: hypothetical protein VGK22_05680 [Candidatus Angelobacter sp.]|jgi:hypothetical protein
MNRLRLLVIGAALITGGSALASAQTVRQDVAYHDRDRNRDDRRFDNRYRDNHVVYREYRVERPRYEIGARRWYGGRWQHWNGSAWCY